MCSKVRGTRGLSCLGYVEIAEVAGVSWRQPILETAGGGGEASPGTRSHTAWTAMPSPT